MSRRSMTPWASQQIDIPQPGPDRNGIGKIPVQRERDLQPLSTPLGRGKPGHGIKISCCKCGDVKPYNDAHANGWTFDKNGTPFTDYYCLRCNVENLP